MENYTWSTFHVNNHWFDATQFLLRLREVYKTVKYNHVAETRPVAENWKGEHHRQGDILFLQNLNNK